MQGGRAGKEASEENLEDWVDPPGQRHRQGSRWDTSDPTQRCNEGHWVNLGWPGQVGDV